MVRQHEQDHGGRTAEKTADPGASGSGGGWPLSEGWARATLSPTGVKLWQTLNHKSAWGTGGQKGGFSVEISKLLQRCLKSVQRSPMELRECHSHYEPINRDDGFAYAVAAFCWQPPWVPTAPDERWTLPFTGPQGDWGIDTNYPAAALAAWRC